MGSASSSSACSSAHAVKFERRYHRSVASFKKTGAMQSFSAGVQPLALATFSKWLSHVSVSSSIFPWKLSDLKILLAIGVIGYLRGLGGGRKGYRGA